MKLIVTLAIAVALTNVSRAQNQAAPIANLPSDLALVPSDTPLFVAFDLSKYWEGPETEALNRLANSHPVVVTWWLKEMPSAIGVQPENVVRATMFGDGGAMTATIFTKAAYDRDKVVSAFAPESTQKTVAGKTYSYSEKNKNSVCFVDDHTLLLEVGQDLGNFWHGQPRLNATHRSILRLMPRYTVRPLSQMQAGE